MHIINCNYDVSQENFWLQFILRHLWTVPKTIKEK